MTRSITCGLQRLREGLFLQAQGVTVAQDPGPVIRAAGENGGTGGRTDGIARVEALEAQAAGGHGVEVGSLEDRMSAIAGLAPAHVVRHDEENVGSLRSHRHHRDDD